MGRRWHSLPSTARPAWERRAGSPAIATRPPRCMRRIGTSRASSIPGSAFRGLRSWTCWPGNGPTIRTTRIASPSFRRLENDGRYLSGVEHSATVTWVGHATFAVHDRGDVFLTDPHFSKRALIPARAVPPGLPLESIPADAFAVVSHNHYDHLDEDSVTGLPADRRLVRAEGAGRLVPRPGPRGRDGARLVAERAPRSLHDHAAFPRSTGAAVSDRARARRSGAPGSSTRATTAISSPVIPAISRASRSTGVASRRSTSRCSRSAPTSRAGSWPINTWIPQRPTRPSSTCGPA